MQIRLYQPEDREALKALHERENPGTWWADPDDPSNPWTLVAEENGVILASLTGRLTVEAFLAINREAMSPNRRLGVLTSLARKGTGILTSEGIPEVHLFPRDKRFAQRLERFPGVRVDPRIHMYMNVGEAGEGASWAT